MERETLKRAIAGGVVTVALGWAGISFLGGDKEAPAAPPKPRVVQVADAVKAKPQTTRVAVAPTTNGRITLERKPEIKTEKPARHRNRTEQPIKRKQRPCG